MLGALGAYDPGVYAQPRHGNIWRFLANVPDFFDGYFKIICSQKSTKLQNYLINVFFPTRQPEFIRQSSLKLRFNYNYNKQQNNNGEKSYVLCNAYVMYKQAGHHYICQYLENE